MYLQVIASFFFFQERNAFLAVCFLILARRFWIMNRSFSLFLSFLSFGSFFPGGFGSLEFFSFFTG